MTAGTAAAPAPATRTTGRSALAVYEAALRRAGAGLPAVLALRGPAGDERRTDAAVWCLPHRAGDTGLLDRCAGATLDVGCGPGRLAATLHRLGRPTLGIDLSAVAVRMARRRGAPALRRDVFGPVPGPPEPPTARPGARRAATPHDGRGWRHILLADGNIGIGGDPVRLLRRCHSLISAGAGSGPGSGGHIHVEVTAPGTGSWVGPASVRLDGGPPDAVLEWASVACDDLPAMAARARLRTVSVWTEARRWFVTLAPA